MQQADRLTELWRLSRPELRQVDLPVAEVRCKVPVDVHREPRIAVSEDPLHDWHGSARLHQQALCCVPKVVEANLPHPRLRPEQCAMRRTAPPGGIGLNLFVLAALPPTDVQVTQ